MTGGEKDWCMQWGKVEDETEEKEEVYTARVSGGKEDGKEGDRAGGEKDTCMQWGKVED